MCLPSAILARVARNAGQSFAEQARAFALDYLKTQGPSSSEAITDACKAAGIIPHDDRAFGPVYQWLAAHNLIEFVGVERRTKGHGSHGATTWKAA